MTRLAAGSRTPASGTVNGTVHDCLTATRRRRYHLTIRFALARGRRQLRLKLCDTAGHFWYTGWLLPGTGRNYRAGTIDSGSFGGAMSWSDDCIFSVDSSTTWSAEVDGEVHVGTGWCITAGAQVRSVSIS